MKKALSILTAGCLAVSLAACGSTAASSAASAADSTASSAAESTAASDTAAADGQTYKVSASWCSTLLWTLQPRGLRMP